MPGFVSARAAVQAIHVPRGGGLHGRTAGGHRGTLPGVRRVEAESGLLGLGGGEEGSGGGEGSGGELGEWGEWGGRGGGEGQGGEHGGGGQFGRRGGLGGVSFFVWGWGMGEEYGRLGFGGGGGSGDWQEFCSFLLFVFVFFWGGEGFGDLQPQLLLGHLCFVGFLVAR